MAQITKENFMNILKKMEEISTKLNEIYENEYFKENLTQKDHLVNIQIEMSYIYQKLVADETYLECFPNDF